MVRIGCSGKLQNLSPVTKGMIMFAHTDLPDGFYWAQEGTWYPTKVEVIRGLIY